MQRRQWRATDCALQKKWFTIDFREQPNTAWQAQRRLWTDMAITDTGIRFVEVPTLSYQGCRNLIRLTPASFDDAVYVD